MNVFDIMGPIMIGPSSSHTAGAARIGRIAAALLNEEVKEALIRFHGSFAETYKGHGTDKAIIAGIMGMKPDDERIPVSLELAKERGLQYSFQKVHLTNVHPNTVFIKLVSVSSKVIELQASSVGGGNIIITSVNGMSVNFTGQYTTLIVLHKDTPGMIAEVTGFLAERKINIASFQCSRTEKGSTAVMTIQTDNSVPKETVSEIKHQTDIITCVLLDKIE